MYIQRLKLLNFMTFYSLLPRYSKSAIFILTLFFSLSAFSQKKKMPSDILEQQIVIGLNVSDKVYSDNIEYIIKELQQVGLKVGYYFHIQEHPTEGKKDMKKASEDIQGKEMKYFLKFQLVFNSLQNNYVWFLYMSPIYENKELLHYEKGYPRYSASTLDKLIMRLVKSIH